MNLVRDRLRRKKRGPGFVELTSIAEETDEIAFADHANPQPTNPMDRAEQSACLTRCIARLPQVEREVIMLRHYSDMSFAEIADLMQSPLGTALARAHRGLAKLRQWMESSEQV
jgi:RNA polymerase sigma-70 factor (ECF subfamily)